MTFSVAYFAVYFLLFLMLLALIRFLPRVQPNAVPQPLPRVSILIAARNEAHNILRCLQSIETLDYPKDRLEVLIGDDASTDGTFALVQEFIRHRPGYQCVAIRQDGKTKGKANVLAQLAHRATTDYYLYTDADVAVPPQWVQSMLSGLTPKVGVVTGITTVKGGSLFARLQALDWLYALGLMQVVSDLKLPVTTMGNNMLLRREAYEEVGGYEGIPFSLTEDIAMFNALTKRGWGFRNLYQSQVLALSEPAASLPSLLNQRKRWMRGSMHLPLYMVMIFVLHSAYYPVLLPFFAYTTVWMGIGVFAIKLLLQSFYLRLCLRRLNQSVAWWYYAAFELYLVITSITLIIYFFIPLRITWKGRSYR